MQIENFIFMQTMEYFGCDARDSELSLLLIFSASSRTDALHPGRAQSVQSCWGRASEVTGL